MEEKISEYSAYAHILHRSCQTVEKDVIFTAETVAPQITDLLAEYSNLAVIRRDTDIVQLHGAILVCREYNGYILNDEYELDIYIPLNSDQLPYAIDTGEHIDNNYCHYYSDRRLCLETDTRIRIRFVNGFNLIEWMKEYVEVYYFSYEYYKRFGVYPFGERSHYDIGILQTYQDLFCTSSIQGAFALMQYISDNNYRGHTLCPCGSRKHIRSCHGDVVLSYMKDMRLKKIVLNDTKEIERKLNNNY